MGINMWVCIYIYIYIYGYPTYFHSSDITNFREQRHPENLTGSQLVEKFPAFYGTQRFITAFTSARHLSLSWTRSIHFIPPSHVLKTHFNIILPSTPGSSNFPQVTPSKRCMHLSSPPYMLHAHPSHSSLFEHPYNI